MSRRQSRSYQRSRNAFLFTAAVVAAVVAVLHRSPVVLRQTPLPQKVPEPAAGAGTLSVERAVDGDTVVMSDGTRVRYIGVDTPELHHPRKPVEAYAKEAWEFNRSLVEGKPVRLEYDLDKHDRYHRLLAYVYLEDGTFVNAELVKQGYAHVYTKPPNVRHAKEFLALQKEAREAGRGLWAPPPSDLESASTH